MYKMEENSLYNACVAYEAGGSWKVGVKKKCKGGTQERKRELKEMEVPCSVGMEGKEGGGEGEGGKLTGLDMPRQRAQAQAQT